MTPFLWMLVQYISEMHLFHISKNNFWVKIHFNFVAIQSLSVCSSSMFGCLKCTVLCLPHLPLNISSVESQKGLITIQQCSIENQKGAVTVQVYGDSALLVLNGILLNRDNALLALIPRYYIHCSSKCMLWYWFVYFCIHHVLNIKIIGTVWFFFFFLGGGVKHSKLIAENWS